MKTEITTIGFPVEIIDDGKYINITPTEESKKIIGPMVVCAKTREEAEKRFWNMVESEFEYLNNRSNELDLWKPFQKGDWSHIGGTWITIFGINIYFRKGKGMKYGKYIPFTNLNIMINNYWKIWKK